MPADDEMTNDERRKYLKKMRKRYQRANRDEKGRLLSEMEAVTGLHRKSLVRLLNQASLTRLVRPRRARRRTYGVAVEHVVILVWESLDYLCAERRHPALRSTARQLARFGELVLTPDLEAQLTTISRATVQRMLSRHPVASKRLPQRGPEQANRLRQAVPLGRIPWDTTDVGHCEVDLVHHRGSSAAGEYAHTLQLVDLATGWSERVALLGRSQYARETAFRQVLARIPFPIVELHPDNGSEFFNHHLLRFFGETLTGMQLSRSRPYHKNDHRLVEQKNATLVRAYLGQLRLDTPEQVDRLNGLYDDLWIYSNLFQPVLHLASKMIVNNRVRRTWDTAQTPYQRLLATGQLTADANIRLAELAQQTNPRTLRQRIYRQVAALWQDHLPLDMAAD